MAIFRNGVETINRLLSETTNSVLAGNITSVGTVSSASSNGTTTITKNSHGLSVAAGDLLHIQNCTTAADKGFYRIVSSTANTFVIDRALSGTDSDILLTVYKDVIGIFATDGVSGQRIMNYSHQNKPLQIGGDTLAATGHSLTSQDVLIGGKLEVDGASFIDNDLTIAGIFTMTTGDAITQTAGNQFDIDPFIKMRLGRSTNNAGFGVEIYKGDGTGAVNHLLDGTGNSYLAGDNGNVGIGGVPNEKLEIVGSTTRLANIFGVSTDGINTTLKVKSIGTSAGDYPVTSDVASTGYNAILNIGASAAGEGTNSIHTRGGALLATAIGSVGIGTTLYSPQKLTVWDGGLSVQNTGTLGSESLNETAFTTHAKWDVTGDMTDSTGAAVYTHATGVGTLTQTSGNLAVTVRANRWYKLTGTFSGVTAGTTAVLTTGIAATQQTITVATGALAFSDGGNYFLSAAAPGNFVISVTSTGGGFTLDDVSLKEVQGGDVHVGGRVYLQDGSAAAPALTFGADSDSGFYRNDSGEVVWSANNGSIIGFSSVLKLASTANLVWTSGDAVAGGDLILSRAAANILKVGGDIWPATDNTYYLGKNDDDTPFAWKGVILKDTTNGTYYRVEVINGVVTATSLTD